FDAAQTGRSVVDAGDHLDVARRLRHVPDRTGVGRVPLLAVLTLSTQARTVAHALRRPDAMASLRRPHRRPRVVHVGVQRPAVDGSDSINPRDGSDATATGRVQWRPA